MIILGQVCILTGVHEYNHSFTKDPSPLGIINIVVFFALLLFCEIAYQIFLYRRPKEFPSPAATMNVSEFDQKVIVEQ
jgi:hypothetical protein